MAKRSARRDSGYSSVSRSRGRSTTRRAAPTHVNSRQVVKYKPKGQVSKRGYGGDDYYGGVVNNIRKNYSRYFDPTTYVKDAFRTGWRGLKQTFTKRPSQWKDPSRGTVYEPLLRAAGGWAASGKGIGGVRSNSRSSSNVSMSSRSSSSDSITSPSKREPGRQEVTPRKRSRTRGPDRIRPADQGNSLSTMGNVKMQSASIKEAWVNITINNPKRKRYVGRPIHYLVQDAEQIASGSGVQNFHTFACFGSRSQWITDTPTTSLPIDSQKKWFDFNPGKTFKGDGTFYKASTPISDQKFALESVNYELHLSNIGELPVVMDMYYLSTKCYTDDTPEVAWSVGTTNQQYNQGDPVVAQPAAGGTGTLGTFGRYTREIVGSVPEKFRYFRQNYKIHKKVSINLDPGETKMIHHNIRINKTCDKSFITENVNDYPRNCVFVFGIFRGVPCVDKTDGMNLRPTWSPAVISYCEIKKHKFRQVRGIAETDVDPMLATSAVSAGATAANLSFVKDATDTVDAGFNNA